MAYRPSIIIVLFLIFFNSGAVFLTSTGAADYLGINPNTGDDEALNTAENASQQYDTGTGQGQTLLGTYNRLASTLNSVVNAIQPGKEMLESSGVPASVTGFLWSGFGIILGLDIALFIRRG